MASMMAAASHPSPVATGAVSGTGEGLFPGPPTSLCSLPTASAQDTTALTGKRARPHDEEDNAILNDGVFAKTVSASASQGLQRRRAFGGFVDDDDDSDVSDEETLDKQTSQAAAEPAQDGDGPRPAKRRMVVEPAAASGQEGRGATGGGPGIEMAWPGIKDVPSQVQKPAEDASLEPMLDAQTQMEVLQPDSLFGRQLDEGDVVLHADTDGIYNAGDTDGTKDTGGGSANGDGGAGNEEDDADCFASLFSAVRHVDTDAIAGDEAVGMLPLAAPPVRYDYEAVTCSGRTVALKTRAAQRAVAYEAMVAARSRTKEGRATRSYYGIDIHALLDGAKKELAQKAEAAAEATAATEATEAAVAAGGHTAGKAVAGKQRDDQGGGKGKKAATMLWTEKYRARSFMDLVGDDLTNRRVLQWLKRWDALVFPHAARARLADSAEQRRRRRRQMQQELSSGGGGGDGKQQQHGAGGGGGFDHGDQDKPHRKILMLTGPPGLGKTTLAHVCARQAGYEVLEINASDERSRDVVNGRIRTSLGTESVKTVEHATTAPATGAGVSSASASSAATAGGKPRGKARVARPVCVIVDEVDGVVGGSGGSGEGGFVKALMDLVQLDQRNSSGSGGKGYDDGGARRRKKKTDSFRQMRPLILICNDVYHASLRPLRQSGLAEILHVGKPSVDAVVGRLKSIFEKEGICCEKEAARKLCEAAWGMGGGPDAGAAARRRGIESNAEGDLRGVMVVGEWVARRLRAADAANPANAAGLGDAVPALTRFWVDKHILPDLSASSSGLGARGLGRGGAREIVSRVFQLGAGFPKSAATAATTTTTTTTAAPAAAADSTATRVFRHEQPQTQMSFAEHQQRYGMGRLYEMVATSGDVDRIVMDIFAEFPLREFNDDSYLSKPDAAYEWLHFHDLCSRRVFGSQEWELAPYTSQPVLACHELFASSASSSAAAASVQYHQSSRHPQQQQQQQQQPDDLLPPMPFSGLRADFEAREAEKHNRAVLQTLQLQLPPSLMRAFRNADDVAVDLLPYVVRLVSPDVKPVLVHLGGGGGGGSGGTNNAQTSVASVRRESEKVLVRRAAEVLAELGISMRRGMLEDAPGTVNGRPQWVYRMEPDLDMLSSFETAGSHVLPGQAPTRYAVRQVVDQELRKTLAQRENAARQARFEAGRPVAGLDAQRAVTVGVAARTTVAASHADKENTTGRHYGQKLGMASHDGSGGEVKRDFFGRVIAPTTGRTPLQEGDGNAPAGQQAWAATAAAAATAAEEAAAAVWVTFHEGLNNAVRKPISLEEFLRGL